ncbi:MAG: FAD-dependent oxidoreductase [Clostridia bacterium]|nr:FAD-dependent oxidoreductase [Clostridia bacterium]
MTEKRLQADLAVIGGGLSGICAAIAAARLGSKVVLIHDRPVLGGNASSEIRVWVRGAKGKYNREGGILRELELENIYRNPTLNYSLWDSVMYEKVTAEPNITLLLNTTCLDADCEAGTIRSVRAWQLTTYTYYTVEAELFVDSSGDSILAEPTGALYRVGREAKDEYNESMAQDVPDTHTMGMSCLVNARETDRASGFIPPSFANLYADDDDFSARPRPETGGKGKVHAVQQDANFWWIEKGGARDSLHDTEEISAELQRVTYGIWDHIKNHGDHNAENFEVDWIGALPGKRESRRYVGDYVLTANDLIDGGNFPDAVAYGGWTMDNHDPRGIDAEGYSSTHYAVHSPYQIPYRALYSKNVSNLFFAGRNISATHMAFSSTRVMATCSLIGQAVGTAAAICKRYGLTPREAGQEKIGLIQQILLENDGYIPGVKRAVSPQNAKLRADLSDEMRAVLKNGCDRPDENAANAVAFDGGAVLEYCLDAPAKNLALHLVFDPDYERTSISKHHKYRAFAMRGHVLQGLEPLRMPAELVRDFCVTDGDGNIICESTDNRMAYRLIDLPDGIQTVKIKLRNAWGGNKIRLFACDFTERRI